METSRNASPAMPAGDEPTSTDGQSSSESDPSIMAVTNYGSQIKFNYGTISNYFCKHDHDAQHSAIPSSAASLPSQLHTKLQTGCALYKSERYIEAKTLFDGVLQDPDLKANAVHIVKYDLARAHYALSEYTQAARLFEDVTSYREQNQIKEDMIDSSINNSRFWLACCFFSLQQFDEASCQFQIIIMTEDDRLDTQQVTRARLWLGLTFERLGQYDSARDHLEMAYSILVHDTTFGPEHLDTLAYRHHLANFFYKRKAYSEALAHYRDLRLAEERMSGPEKAEAIKTRCMMVLCLGQLREWQEVEQHLPLLVPRIEKDPGLRLNELEDIGLLYLWLGKTIWNRGDPRSVAEANFMLHRALKHLHSNKALKEELEECQLGLAEIMNFQGHFSQAEHTIRQTLPTLKTPHGVNRLAWHYTLAVALYQQTRMREAVSVLEPVIYIGKGKQKERASKLMKHKDLYSHGGVDRLHLLFALHTPAGHLRRAAVRSGGRLDCLQLLGVIHARLADPDTAHYYFQKVVEEVPMSDIGLSKVSRFYLRSVQSALQDFENARKQLQDSQQLTTSEKSNDRPGTESREPIVDAMLGRALCALQLFDEAEPYLRPIITMFSDHKQDKTTNGIVGHAYFCLGRCLLHRKDFRGASNYFERTSPMIGRSFGFNGYLYLECRYHLACCLGISRAKPIFEELLRSSSQEPDTHEFRSILAPFWLGYINSEQRRREDAERLSRKALEGWGDAPSYQGIRREEAVLALAQTLCRTRKREATEECRLLMQGLVENDSIGVEQDRATFLGSRESWFVSTRQLLATSNYRTRRFEEAYNMFKISTPKLEVLRGYDHVESSLARAHQADCLSELGRFEEAELLVNSAATHDEKNPHSPLWRVEIKSIGIFWLGCQEVRNGNLRKARSYFTEVQRLWPPSGTMSRRFWWEYRNFDSRYQLICIDQKDGKGNNVQASLSELLKQQQDAGYLEGAADSCWTLASILRSQKSSSNLQAAKSLYGQIIENKRDGKFEKNLIYRSHSNLGHCLLSDKNYQEAKDHFEQFTTISTLEGCPPSVVEAPDCLYWASRSYAAIGNWAEARVQLENAHSSRKHEDPYRPNGHKDSTQELVVICTKFQYLRCVVGQLKLPEPPILDIVFGFFERWCSTAAANETDEVEFSPSIDLVEFELGRIANSCQQWGQAVVFLEMALAKNESKSARQSHSGRKLPILECKSELGVALVRLGRYEDAVIPLCKVLEGRKDAARTIGDSSATPPHEIFNHEVRIMKAKLQLSGAAHGAAHHSEAEVLAQEVLAWAENDEREPQEQLIARRRGLAARMLLARIAHETRENYVQAASYCSDALGLLSKLRCDLPFDDFDYEEIRLNFDMARALAKLPDRRDEGVACAIKALELEDSRKRMAADLVGACTEVGAVNNRLCEPTMPRLPDICDRNLRTEEPIEYKLLRDEFGSAIDAHCNE
ncbi:hypothetical protein NPX13_g7751 [Xylaria arbuscula]|uniref:TPR-like protein n=1 Tax=Xylaria arbuscula TaxID=114810 RepID=A0A9W8N9F1_9PEZI|nr:hypothetical protein NPX13_g7751 [Xylaria arbuscula]